MVSVRRQLVDTRFGQVHFRQVFGAEPTLLLLHMSPLSGGMYQSLMEGLAGRRAAIAPDRYGSGGSDPVPQPLSMAEYAAGVVDILDALEVEQVNVLGTHTGAFEAVALALLAPERVGRLALVAAPIFTSEEIAALRPAIGSPHPTPTEDGAHLNKLWRKRFTYRMPPYDVELLHWRLIEELNAPGAHLAYAAVFDYPLEKRLPQITQPLTVFAPHDDVFDQTERAKSVLPDHADYVELPHLGLDLFHYATEEMTRRVLAAL